MIVILLAINNYYQQPIIRAFVKKHETAERANKVAVTDVSVGVRGGLM